jgi:uncharacterized protein YcbX
MPTVASFNLTPVKSTALQQPRTIDLTVAGAAGDRRFLFARADGTRLSGISKAPLMPIVSSWDRDEERLTLRLPDGVEVDGDARPVGPLVDVALYDRSVPARALDTVFEEPMRAIDPTLTLLRVDEPEYAGGVHRVSVISRASVAEIGARGGDPGLDPRRFRMLVEINGLDPYEEDGWQGREVRIGTAVIQLGDRMPRCVMTTLDPDTGRRDFDTLDVLAAHRKVGTNLLLGVYGDVVRPGIVGVGDEVSPLG